MKVWVLKPRHTGTKLSLPLVSLVSDPFQWEVFIIPNRAHPIFSKGVVALILSALVALGVRSKTSKFADLSMFGSV